MKMYHFACEPFVNNFSKLKMVPLEYKLFCFKLTLKVIMYSSLIVTFVVFFLKDQMLAYIEGRTTMSSRVLKSNQLEFPSIGLCFEPGTKYTVRKKYKLKNPWSVFHETVPNLTIPQVFNEQSFILDRDFRLYLDNEKKYKPDFHHSMFLHLSLNNLTIGNSKEIVSVDTVRNYAYSNCHKVTLLKKVEFVPFELKLHIIFDSKLEPINKPEYLVMYLITQNAWRNFAADWWPRSGRLLRNNQYFRNLDIGLGPARGPKFGFKSVDKFYRHGH